MDSVLKTPVLALIAGATLGALAMLLVGNSGSGDRETREVVRDLGTVPTMTQVDADKHREQRYVTVTTIEGVVRLPTEFMRSEAIYALAGRSDSAAILVLVFEADRIADDVEREQLLGILFFRLAEVDPQSALALARSDQFRTMKSLERTVWRAWGRNDLDEALFAAKTQDSIVDQKFAAQSLYAAFGYMGNTTTERIEAELGIEPDRSTRGRYLYRLADQSPAEAIAFINGVADASEKQQYISWLAYYLSLSDPEQALRYGSLFATNLNAERFEQIVKSNIAQESPHATIERLIASGLNLQTSREFGSAIQALAKTDIEAAIGYFQQIRSIDGRRHIGAATAAEFARRDPDAAFTWAQENEFDQYPFLQMSVLTEIASKNPQHAMGLALALPDSERKSQLLSQVVQGIAFESPTNAIAYLDTIDNADQKLAASQYLVQSWARRDPAAALEWVLSQDDRTRIELLERAQFMLVDSDIETAIRFAPRIDGRAGDLLKRQIAARLVLMASPEEAMSFIRQFEGEDGFDQLRSTVIEGLAQTDVYAARRLADQLPSGPARDRSYMTIIASHARSNPVEATRWLASVSDPRLRGSAAGQLASSWYASDPAAANQWVLSLPAGAMRDYSVAHMAAQWRNPDPQQLEMLERISDPAIRSQAKTRRIFNLMRTDPDKARELADDEDISEQDRKSIELMLRRSGRIY